MRGKLLLTAGLTLSVAMVAFGPRGDRPPLFLATRAATGFGAPKGSLPESARRIAIRRHLTPGPPPPVVHRPDPRRFDLPVRPPMVRDLFYRYP